MSTPQFSDHRSLCRAWIPALVWLGIIAIESTSALSSENTARFLYPALHFLFNLDPLHFSIWHFYMRKTGHVLGYGILSVLLFRAWRVTLPVYGNPPWSIVWARTALFMTALVASLDEWHQTFIPTRTGSLRDVLLDSTAALVAQILFFLWLQRGRLSKLAASSERALPSCDPERSKARASSPVGD
jgi:VanZ family protein